MSVDSHVNSLSEKHIGLEAAIAEELQRPCPDSDRISEMKKEKLLIKDELERLTHH